MNEEKNIFINDLSLELSKLLEILLENQNNSSKYAIPKIRQLLTILEEFRCDKTYSNAIFFNIIREKYQSMFPPKMGLSEFHIWNDDFDIMKKENRKYSDILNNIDIILNQKELF